MPNKKATKKKSSKKKIIKKKKRCTDPRTLKVSDNIPKGSELQVPSGIFVAFFGNDLLKHYTPKDEDKVKK